MREGLASILIFGVFAASFILKEAFIMQIFRRRGGYGKKACTVKFS
jgi:hypothetical protein